MEITNNAPCLVLSYGLRMFSMCLYVSIYLHMRVYAYVFPKYSSYSKYRNHVCCSLSISLISFIRFYSDIIHRNMMHTCSLISPSTYQKYLSEGKVSLFHHSVSCRLGAIRSLYFSFNNALSNLVANIKESEWHMNDLSILWDKGQRKQMPLAIW